MKTGMKKRSSLNLSIKLITLGLVAVAINGCGKVNRQTDSNSQSALFYSQFMTSSNGISTGKDLVGNCQGAQFGGQLGSGCGSSQYKMQLDNDGTYRIYTEQITGSISSFNSQSNGAVGVWKIDQNNLVLDGIGSTVNSSYNLGAYAGTYNTSCINIKFDSKVVFDTAQFFNQDISAGTNMQFCKSQ